MRKGGEDSFHPRTSTLRFECTGLCKYRLPDEFEGVNYLLRSLKEYNPKN